MANGLRWPVEPLLARARMSLSMFSKTYGVSTTQLRRPLSDKLADRYAVRAGFHPSEVWPDWCDRFDREERVRDIFDGLRRDLSA